MRRSSVVRSLLVVALVRKSQPRLHLLERAAAGEHRDHHRQHDQDQHRREQMPPTTTRASGLCTCEPMPVEKAAGNRPTQATTQVIITGRICTWQVRRIAAGAVEAASIADCSRSRR